MSSVLVQYFNIYKDERHITYLSTLPFCVCQYCEHFTAFLIACCCNQFCKGIRNQIYFYDLVHLSQ